MDDFLAQAWPDCSTCGGTGIVEGETFPVALDWAGEPVAWSKNPDRVCHCVPTLIIRAPDV